MFIKQFFLIPHKKLKKTTGKEVIEKFMNFKKVCGRLRYVSSNYGPVINCLCL